MLPQKKLKHLGRLILLNKGVVVGMYTLGSRGKWKMLYLKCIGEIF